jgi:type VI secretion system secreted protein Hcp
MFAYQFLRRAAAIGALAALSASAGAATEDFIKFTGATITGGSQDPAHKGWSDIASFDWGVTVAASPGGGAGVGKPVFSDLSWTQSMDQAFPPLFTALTKGTPLSAELDFTRNAGPGGQTYFKMNFTGAHLTELGLTGSGAPLESAAFDYTTIKFTYYPQNPDGSLGSPITASYNLKTGVGDVAQLGLLYFDAMHVPMAPVPEPATYAMLLAGLGLVGATARRLSKRS